MASNKLKGRRKAVFFRSISTMVSAGIPLHRVLEQLSDHEPEPDVEELYRTLSGKILSGSTFSSALRAEYRSFGTLAISMIELAEQTGSLYLVLERLAAYEERSLRLKQKLRSQLSYPLFLGIFALLALLILPGFCLEGIFRVLEAQGAELPLLSKAFWMLSKATHTALFWFGLLAVSIFSVFGGQKVWDKENTRVYLLSALETFSPFKRLIQSSQMAILSDCLALQLGAGLSPLKAFPIAAQATGDPRAVEAAEATVQRLKEGATISESLEDWPDLPPIFLSMAHSGEVSGSWPHLLSRQALFYEFETENTLHRLVTLLEPLTLCVMGLVFGLIIIATMNPMLQLIQELS